MNDEDRLNVFRDTCTAVSLALGCHAPSGVALVDLPGIVARIVAAYDQMLAILEPLREEIPDPDDLRLAGEWINRRYNAIEDLLALTETADD